ncbi:amidohydrolase [Phlyctema vagabunda]|uniref:Amidohydrolase n=1 Tax=Phlyctema vagabunda TaxID=108571 RepID=A0ABR4PQA6_9HELO
MPSKLSGFAAVISVLAIPFIANLFFVARSTLYCLSNDSFTITTLNQTAPRASCFRVRDGIFREVLAERPRFSFEKVNYIDGHVLPGIIESHGHILQYGEMLESVSLYGATSIDEVRKRVQDFLKIHKSDGYGSREKWVRGIGWDQAFFGGVMPTAEELKFDEDLYIMLDRVDVHCVWVSEEVLNLLPNPLPEAPPGGVIVTDPGPGVFCDNAMDEIVFPQAPKPTIEDKTRWFRTAMSELNKVGIVGVGDAGMRPTDVQILESMAEEGELTIRINVMLECPERNTYCPDDTKDLKILGGNSLGSSSLMLGGVKLFGDGALGSWGAALLEPYSDKAETSGTMLINETQLTEVVKQWYNAGFQVNVHAIGDRANRAAVDAFENVLGTDCEGCNEVRRLRIEHAQIIHPDDQIRIERMGIIPSIQPTHATSDMAYASTRLGTSRISQSAYRMSSLFPSKMGSKYPGPVLGSDFPVEPPNPFHGMYAAVTRLSPATGTSPSGEGGWQPEQKLSLQQALLGFTRNGAYGWLKENETGAIEVGKWADWVVIDTDFWADATGESLRDLIVKETWLNGKRVYKL